MRQFLSSSVDRAQFAPPPPDHVDVRVLAASTVEKHTIPTNARYVVFSSTGNFYAKFGGTSVVAAVPAADVTDGTGSELNPEARECPADTGYISLIADTAVTITMSFYS